MPYNSCRTCLTNRMGSLSRHIMPLVINSLGRGQTHTQARILTIRTGSILRNQARVWFKNGLKNIHLLCCCSSDEWLFFDISLQTQNAGFIASSHKNDTNLHIHLSTYATFVLYLFISYIHTKSRVIYIHGLKYTLGSA